MTLQILNLFIGNTTSSAALYYAVHILLQFEKLRRILRLHTLNLSFTQRT